MDLKEWQTYLQGKMDELDQSWEVLDEVWQHTHTELEGTIGELADKFYQSYWDVFHSAVESFTMDELSEEVQMAITEAQSHVAEAWRAIADDRIRGLEQREHNIASADITPPLAHTRKRIREAKSCRSKASRLIDKDQHLDAVDEFKECLGQCDSADSELDDALSASQVAKTSLKWTKLVGGATIIGTISGIVFFLLNLLLRACSPSP